MWNAARAYSSAFFSFFNRAYARDRMICALYSGMIRRFSALSARFIAFSGVAMI